MVPHGNSSKRLPAGGSFLSGLRREDTGIQSRPNDPDRERKHAKTEVYYPCYDTGWEPHSWGGVRNGGSFLYNALAVYACGGGASVSDLMERPTPPPPHQAGEVYTGPSFNSHKTVRPRAREGTGKSVSMAVPPSLPMLTLGSWPVVSGRWADSFDAQAVKLQWHLLPSHQAAGQCTFLNHSTARAPYRILLNVNLPGWHMTASNHPRRHGVTEAQCPMHSCAAATHYGMRRRTVWGRFGTMEPLSCSGRHHICFRGTNLTSTH